MSTQGQQTLIYPQAAQTESEVVHSLHCCEIKLLIMLGLAAKVRRCYIARHQVESKLSSLCH